MGKKAGSLPAPMPLIYAGIDEAGYGPMYGPLTVGCAALRLEDFPHDAQRALQAPPDLWELLAKAVCRTGKGAKGRFLVNDSKKLKTAASGIKNLEPGVLGFLAPLGGAAPTLTALLDALSPPAFSNRPALPWYAGDHAVPVEHDAAALRIGGNVLKDTMAKAQITTAGLRCNVVYEDRYNAMVAATRNKASVSFTFVAGHLARLWEAFGRESLFVAIDRQGGRTHYRALLAHIFPEAQMAVLEETDERSAYLLEEGPRRMTVLFASGSEEVHLPVALASMTAKYARELTMGRFNAHFARLAPQVAPTAGYGEDANRWRDAILPHLRRAGIDHARLRRLA